MFTGIGSPRVQSRDRAKFFAALVLSFASILTLSLIPDDAHAQRVRAKFKDKVHVVQPKPVLQKGRFEFAPRFGASVNDDIYQSFRAGASANYHISESFYIGGLFDWYDFGDALGGTTNAFEQLSSETGASTDSAKINYAGGLEVGFVPFWGKFSFFNSALIFYDFSVTAGGLWIDAESFAVQSASGKPGGTVALTGHLFLNKWIALNVEVRDVIFLQDLINATDSFTNVITVGAGFSFYLPTTFEYSENLTEATAE